MKDNLDKVSHQLEQFELTGAHTGACQGVGAALDRPVKNDPEANTQLTRQKILECVAIENVMLGFCDYWTCGLTKLKDSLTRGCSDGLSTFNDLYPPSTFQQWRLSSKFKQVKTGRLSLLNFELRNLDERRIYIVGCMHANRQVLQSVDILRLLAFAEGWYRKINENRKVYLQDLLGEEIVFYRSPQLRNNFRQVCFDVSDRQLDILCQFVRPAARVDDFAVDASILATDTTSWAGAPARRTTLADCIAVAGAETLQAWKASSAVPGVVGVHAAPSFKLHRDTHTQLRAHSDLAPTHDDGSDSSDEDLYACIALPPSPKTPPQRAHRRREMFRKQERANGDEGQPQAPAAQWTLEFGRHKARHRTTGFATQPPTTPAPTYCLNKTSRATLNCLMAPSYQQKVTVRAYQSLLADFIISNGPTGTGYLRRPNNDRPAVLNNDSENIEFVRYDGLRVIHSFHYPHGGKSCRELPAAMLHDYRNVFAAFGLEGESA